MEEQANMCPNGCGKMETAYGNVEDNRHRTYWSVTIEYCPECMYTGDVDANL